MAVGGLDIGTSSTKFAVFRNDGSVICESKRKYKEYGTGGIREIHPQEVWSAVVEVLEEAAVLCPEQIDGFAIAALGESFVAVDAHDRVLNASMVTGDNRGIGEGKRIVRQYGRKELIELTGVCPSEMYALPKMIWTKEHTDIFEQTRFLFMYEDYVAYMLTGERKISYSGASRSMAFDIRKQEWCEELLGLAGLNKEMMSEPVPSGEIIGNIRAEICALTGLSEKTVIVAGGHDQMCAALGNGVLESAICGDGMGTCEVMAVPLDGIHTDECMIKNELPCVPYLHKDSYLTYLVMTNCGSLMNWYRDFVMNEKYALSDRMADDRFSLLDEGVPDDPTGLLVIPNFGSSGNPHVDYAARGTIWGLTIHTSPGELFGGFKEGMAYHMKLCFEALGQMGIHPELIRVSGGGAASDVTLRIRADVFGLPVCRMEYTEAGAKGCMLLAASALGIYKNEKEAFHKTSRIEKTFYPDKDRHEQYMTLYEKYRQLYETLYQFHLK
ncbi:FGGY-family carbohydrate kinase [[Clostridium] hylemonae]|uniref:FGGY-family carbohydrate kinase n=1 Tax=[Clostridium] hylemonae TaxID=89153 RepID=UPI001106E165|nr:FGGY-family carbohydrate kinase [[Clostridium] hylemonae]